MPLAGTASEMDRFAKAGSASLQGGGFFGLMRIKARMKDGTRTAATRLRPIATMIFAGGLLSGCGSTSGWLGSPAGESGSVTDRFTQLFGNTSQPAGTSIQQQQQVSEPECPGVEIRSGASTLAVGLPGKPASGPDLRYQGTITQTARECALSGGNIAAKVGVQGRVIVGPAGAPSSVVVPMRIAVVMEGPQPKTVFSKSYQTMVTLPSDQANVPFSLVAEDISYTVPDAKTAGAYVFFVGFDPEGLKPAKAKPTKSKPTKPPIRRGVE